MTLGLSLVAGLGTYTGMFWRADNAIRDAFMPRGTPSTDIAIVAIDDASLEELGRWPWPRRRHAALLDVLREAGATAVALDVVFTEPEEGDAALATAMQAGLPTVLPLLVEFTSGGLPMERLPVPVLAGAAAAIGHVEVEVERDGIVRSVYLQEGLGTANRPQLMVALLRSLHDGRAHMPILSERDPDPPSRSDAWLRDYRVGIPYLGPPGTFTYYSYKDVLRGQIPASALRGKLILVGMTAQGAGDAYPTPLSGYSRAMPGVEINANILEGLRHNSTVRRLPPGVSSVIALFPAWLACWIMLRWPPRRALAASAALFGITLAFSIASLQMLRLEWPCTGTLVAVILAYPLWSWLRLELTEQYFDSEMHLLESESVPLLSSLQNPRVAASRGDVWQHRVNKLRQATARVRNLRRLLADTVRGLPDATLVIDLDGRVVLANSAAARLLGAADADSIQPIEWAQFYEVMTSQRLNLLSPGVVEIQETEPVKNLLVRTVPLFADQSDTDRIGTLVSIVDITAVRAAQREREDFVRFLSHDLKSPASSLLGLAQLQRDPKRALPAAELASRLDALASRTLNLMDGFIAIAHAESLDSVVFSELDLRDALQDACDEVWAYAESRRIQLTVHHPSEPLLVLGDRQLLARAVANLLNNAIKFSKPESAVAVQCHGEQGRGVISVLDAGDGVAAEVMDKLFTRFGRIRPSGKDHPAGAGLGLAFVRIVAEKHRGTARHVASISGARFELEFPLIVDASHGRPPSARQDATPMQLP